MLFRVRSTVGAVGVVAVVVFVLTMAAVAGSAAGSASGSSLVSPFPGPLVQVSPASGSLTRGPESSLGSFPSFGDPQAITVDQSTGDIYVVSPAAGYVSRFTASGAPDDFTAGPNEGTNTLGEFSFDNPSASEVAVAPAGASGGTEGDIYIASYAGIDVYASDGTHLGQITEANGSGFSEACGVATDNAGKLYVGDIGGEIDRYVPSSSPVINGDYDSQISGLESPCGLAADSAGAVYASKWPTGPLTKYTAADFGTSDPGTMIDAASRAVAVDPATDDVYVDEGGRVTVLDSTGNERYSFGSAEEFGTKSAGVAVRAGRGNVYVADSSHHRVDVYGPLATTDEASGVRHVKATLNGHLDPNGGEITDCHFDWGETTAYGSTIPCGQGNDYTTAANVSATLTGLEPSKTYHYRLVVANDTNTVTGNDEIFEATRVPTIYSYASAFGSSGSGDGQLSGDSDVAVDQTTGDVYVADTQNHRIEEFDANGSFISTFGWGVADGKSEAQTCTSNCQAGIAGSGAGQLATPTFVAVDNSGGPSEGDVYIGDTTNNTVTKYDAHGDYVATNDGSGSGSVFGPLAGIAVDHNGNLWVYDTNAEMREFAPDGTYTTEWNSGFGVTPAGIAVDGTDTLYAVRGVPVVERFSATGADEGQVTGQKPPAFNGPTTGLAIDSASGDLDVDDGGNLIRQYPNPSACKASGSEEEGCPASKVFGSGDLGVGGGLAINTSTGRLYVADPDAVKIFDQVIPPDVVTGTASALSPTSAILNGTVGPNGVALTDCHFEYVSDSAFLATGFTDLSSGGTAPCTPAVGSIPPDLEDHQVKATVSGLDPTIVYHYRLVAANAQTTVAGQEVSVPGPPLVETTGSADRTATTARLDSRLDPRGTASTYHFEYGDQGPCDENPCAATAALSAGAGEAYELVSQQITGLKAGTTYHYRLVAENGIPGGATHGQDETLTTRSSDVPLTHGHYPGPPDSDRAWELVSAPDTDGSPVTASLDVADSGERVVYNIEGGSPGSQYGGGGAGSNHQYVERSSNGWRSNTLYPDRTQAPGNQWAKPVGSSDLSTLYNINTDVSNTGPAEIWRMTPGSPAQLVFSLPYERYAAPIVASDDGSRIFARLIGSVDPEHPVEAKYQNLYDVTSGTPHMVGVLPNGNAPVCGIQEHYMFGITPPRAENWIAPDGSYIVFATGPGTNCEEQPTLFLRDLVNSTTKEIAPRAKLIRVTDGAAFFATTESLAADDSGGNDIYRYTIGNGSLDCLTCSTVAAGSVVGGYDETDFSSIAVSDDGSRIYFISDKRLLQGAAAGEGIYRIDASTGNIAYVAPATPGVTTTGGLASDGNAITPDGSMFVFWSASPEMNAVNGQQNGGTGQYYLYDDNDRSLVCASCPGDGGLPHGEVDRGLGGTSGGIGANGSALTSNGDFIFVTPTPLVTADQNTAPPNQDPTIGDDVYEWRDGQLLLVTDGLTLNEDVPEFAGASPDGRNVFFIQAAQLTPDAIDPERRLYDARIGGGFNFPKPPPPCSLEACQGVASPPPSDATPASLSFSGPGNQVVRQPDQAIKQPVARRCADGKCYPSKKRCAKGRTLKRGKCVKTRDRTRVKKANHKNGGAK